MNSLSRHLANRSSDGIIARRKWMHATSGLPAPFRRWAVRKIWRGALIHMRPLTPEILVETAADGRWEFKQDHGPQATSMPLDHLIGRIHRPVSIIATGPSAAGYDWQNIRRADRFVVAVNGAATYLREVGVVPDLLVMTDPEFALSGSRHIHNAPAVPLVTTWRAASMLLRASPADLCQRTFSIIERVNSWYGIPAVSLELLQIMNRDSGSPFHFPENPPAGLKVGWSDVPQLGFFSGCTVVFAALQVVVGLGARDIEIIGMDLRGQSRIYAEGPDAQPSKLELQYQKYILPSFEVMQGALSRSEVQVRNLSPVCPLPAWLFARQQSDGKDEHTQK